MIRTDRNPAKLMPESIPQLAKLNDSVFSKLWELPRFVAEPFIDGPRMIIVFGSKPHVFREVVWDWEEWKSLTFNSTELAGTVVDGVYGDPFGDGSAFYLMDVMRWKGESLTGRPLRERIKFVEKVRAACPKEVYREMYWAYARAAKFCLDQLMCGKVMLKDMRAPYHKGRGWFVGKEW